MRTIIAGIFGVCMGLAVSASSAEITEDVARLADECGALTTGEGMAQEQSREVIDLCIADLVDLELSNLRQDESQEIVAH